MIEWSHLIGSGHRSLTSESSTLHKSFSSVFLVSPDGKHINLLEETDLIKEDHRLILMCGAVGIFGGLRHDMHRGYIQTFSKNTKVWYNDDDPQFGGAKLLIYNGFHIVATLSDSSEIFRFTVQHLADVANLLAYISLSTVEFGDDKTYEEETKSKKLTEEEALRILALL